MGLEIAIAARTHGGKGITAPRGLDLHFLHGFFQRFGVVNRADADAREAAQRIAVERRNGGLEFNRPDAVLLALLDLEGHQESALLGIVFRKRGDHLHVGETALQIVAANKVAVRFDPVGIVGVGAAEEAQQIGFAGLDDVAQPVRGKGDIADELDGLDAGLGAFGNGEDQIDAVVRLFDDLWIDAHVIAAGAAVNFGDALGIGLDHRTGQRAPRLGLDFRGKLLVLDLLVALEGNAADHRVFNHGHYHSTAGLVDLHVLEQSGFDQRFQAVIDAGLVKAPARTRLEIGANGFDFDAPVAFYGNRGGGLGGGG